jgi:nicotinamidase-related amidase
MTLLAGRPNSALLVIDVQTGVVAGAHARDDIVANIARVVEKARAAKVPVIWVRHSAAHLAPDSAPWRIVPELVPADSEPVVDKLFPDAFEETSLGKLLAHLEAGRLIVTGAQTDECIRATLHGGIARGYDMILVSDAHTTEDQTQWGAPPPDKVIAHTNLYWANHRAPGRVAGIVSARDLRFAPG